MEQLIILKERLKWFPT